MAKKITIQGTNLLESLGDAWGGVNDTQAPITPYEGKGAETVVPPGKEWGVTKDEVERFIKAQLGTKVGDIRWHKPESSNYYDLLVFATKADATAWDADKTLENYIGRKQLPISAVQSDSYIATLSTSKTGSTTQAPFVVKRGEDWVVPVRLNAWHIISATGQQIFIPVTATVVVERSTNGQNWTQVRTATVSSTESESGFPNSINVGPSLDTGQDAQYQVRLRVLPFVIEDVEDPITAQAIVMYVKTVTLSVSMSDNEWQQAKELPAGSQALSMAFTLLGNVPKTLHVEMTNISGVVTHQENFNTSAVGNYDVSLYDRTGTEGIAKSGVHEVRAWVTCDNGEGGTLTSDIIVHQIMVVNAGEQAEAMKRRVLIQGMHTSVDNFVQSEICKYMVWNPKLVNGRVVNDTSEKVQVQFIVADSSDLTEQHEEYLTLPVTTTPAEKESLVGTMEVESAVVSDYYNAYLHAVDTEGTSLLQRVLLLTIDNTAGFQPIPNAVFKMNPKTRNNGEANPKTIINTRDNGAIVESIWEGFKMDDSDGYITNESGEKVLRVPAGRKLTIRLNPFDYFYTAPQASKALTIQIPFSVRNITNEKDPILRIAEYQSALNAWLGLLLRPMDGTMVSVASNGVAGETDFRWAEDRKQDLQITIIPNVQPNAFGDIPHNTRDDDKANGTINLVRVYVNGVIIRELRYTPGNATEFCTGPMSNDGIIIGQTGTEGRNSGADIDIYGITIWHRGLTPQEVFQNRVSGVADPTEKRRLKAMNNILRDDNTGRLALGKCHEAGKNTIVWHGDIPLIDDDSKKGWIEIRRYSYDGTYLPEYSGTICKATKNLKGKGQGTTAMTYYFWNIQVKLGDVTDTITITPDMLHSSITAEWDASYDWGDGETGAWMIKGGCLGKNFPLPTEKAVAYHGTEDTIIVPDGWIDGNGKYRGKCWCTGPNRPLSQKLVLKINYASSMQSHLIGVNWLYNTLHTAICGNNALQNDYPYAQVAKQTEPMLFFTAGKNVEDETETLGTAVYQGPGAFGPGKMDKPTWGYVKSAHPDFAMYEGAANNTVLSDFLAPFDDTDHILANGTVQRAKVKYFLQDPYNPGVAKDPESFYYRHTVLRQNPDTGENEEVDQWEKGISFDAGKTGRKESDGLIYNNNSCDNPDEAPAANITTIFRNAANYVYLHNPNINLYRGTFADFQQRDFSEWELKQKWVCRANGDDASNYLVKRWDFCERRWVDAGLWNADTHAYDAIDIRQKEGMNWDSMTPEEKADHAGVLAKYKRLLREEAYPTESNAGIGAYFKVSSLKFHYAFINTFIAGTDNCSKNTYYVIDPVTLLIELHQDDVDTVMPTDNYGYQTKPYYIDRTHPYPEGSSISGYDGMQNGLFDLVEDLWLNDSGHSIAQMMGQVLSTMADLTGGIGSTESSTMSGVWRCLNRYLFDIQRYIPAVAYNEAARIRYEFPAMIGYTGRDGQARPLAQSMGDQLEAEIQFMKRRLVYMASYAGFGEFSPSIGSGRRSIGLGDMDKTFSVPVTVLPNGGAPSYTFRLTPHQYLYPCLYKESSTFQPFHRTAPGEEYEYTISGLSANDYALVLPALNYYRSIGNVGDMSAQNSTFALELAGSRLTEFVAKPTLYYPVAGGNPISAEAWKALADKSGYLPAYRPLNASIPQASGATRVRRLVLSGLPTLSHSSAIPLDLRRMTQVEEIDLRDTNVSAVRIPETPNLTSLSLPANLTQLTLTEQPNLATLNIQGYGNLVSLVVTGSPLLGQSLRAHILNMKDAGAAVETIRLTGINWMGQTVDADVIRWLLSVGDNGVCELAGKIAVVIGAQGILYYEDVVKLITRYGNIRDEENALYVHFAGTSISQSSVSIEGKKYINTDISSTEYDLDVNQNFNGLDLLVASGNDVAVATNGAGNTVPDVVWELIGAGASVYAEFADPYSPVLHMKQTGAAVENVTLLVRATLTNTSGNTRVVEKQIGLWNRIPEVGDYAWTDGQFDNTNDASKQMAGIVIGKEKVVVDDHEEYDLIVLGAADTSFPTSKVAGGYESSWGMFPVVENGFSDAKTNGEYDDPLMEKIRQKLQNWVKPSGIDYGTTTAYLTDIFDTPLQNMGGDMYIRKNAEAVAAAGNGIAMQDESNVANNGYATYSQNYMNNFKTKEENAIMMSFANVVLFATFEVLNITQEDFPDGCTDEGIPTTTEALYDLAELIVQKASDAGADNPARYRELLFPAFRRCNVWCPSDISNSLIDESKLHEAYKRGKWMIPASGWLARIFNFMANSRGAAAYNTGGSPSADYADENVALEALLPLFANCIARGRAVPISSGSNHWSSTEGTRHSARDVSFSNGYTSNYNKCYGNVVRAVTVFRFKP